VDVSKSGPFRVFGDIEELAKSQNAKRERACCVAKNKMLADCEFIDATAGLGDEEPEFCADSRPAMPQELARSCPA
jgi:hypothetical protein